MSTEKPDSNAGNEADPERLAAEILLGTGAARDDPISDKGAPSQPVAGKPGTQPPEQPQKAVAPVAPASSIRWGRVAGALVVLVIGGYLVVFHLLPRIPRSKSSLEKAIESKQGLLVKSLVLREAGAWEFGTLETEDERKLPIAARSSYAGRTASHKWILGQDKATFLGVLKPELKQYGLTIREENLEQNDQGISWKGWIKVDGDVLIVVDEFFQPVGQDSIVSERELTIPEEHLPAFARIALTQRLLKPVTLLGEGKAIDVTETMPADRKKLGTTYFEIPAKLDDGTRIRIVLESREMA
jgi:hypothetical protein